MNKILNLNGCLVSYRIVGTGSPIILLHGFLEDLTMWDRVSLLLQTSHTVLAIDLPGHGLSNCQMEAKNMANMARVVKAVCDTEKIANPIVFGHSMGG
ncbi:MAG: alpha/beta hydrolase, partial [Putridiphycobacter sp.]|nr:alpha/beta hydrolase [Putridiphycobacter sp.]